MSVKIIHYLRKLQESVEQNPLGEISVMGLKIYIKEPVPEHVHIKYSVYYILEKMPKMFYENINRIIIGQFPFLKKREVDAIYKDKCIYVTNNQESNESLIADIIHELAHAFEDQYREDIYGDLEIENEFLSKRKALYNILKANNLIPKTIGEKHFQNLNYDQDFDLFLYKTVGYNKLSSLMNGIFISPYAATCLREYFANAFEIFFTKDMFVAKKQATSVHNKLINYLEF